MNHDKLRELAQATDSGQWYDGEPDEYPVVLAGRDMKFIAAANPTVVLALLDELRDAKRGAWDKGYDAGRNDGWHDTRDHTPNPYRDDA